MSKIIIGASNFGARINWQNSLNLIDKIIDRGFIDFDTAPLYGAGLSHYIFQNVKKKINLTTKIGQPLKLSSIETLKRIYRFQNYSLFKKSFDHFYYKKRMKKDFWEKENIDSILQTYRDELGKHNIKKLFFHRPPKHLMDGNIIKNFINFCEDENLEPGICNISQENLKFVYNKKITLQVSMNFYLKNKLELNNSKNNIEIYGLFTTLESITKSRNKNSANKFFKELKRVYFEKDQTKLVIGINSTDRLEELVKFDYFINNVEEIYFKSKY